MKLFLTALAVMISSVAFAQTLTVTGDVTDASTGEPVPFASVHEKGTMNGVNTDADGHYTITVGQNSVLVFSSIGYATVEVAVEGKMQVNCELPLDAETLETAIAVGYGSAKKVGTMIGSVTTVKSEGIKNAPSSSALDALQGQVAGLAVMTTGGVAGENNVSMTLHGVGSLGSSSAPLYIIDGVQASSSAIMNMNPNDILSISILKDASATSIYGSRAANGVVFVTTRTGSYDAKATVTIRSQAGISTLADNTLYENMMTGEELKDFWIRTGIATPQYIYDTYTSKGHDHNTRWYKYVQQLNNPQYQNDIIVEGGGNKVAYMIGASQFHQRGTAIGNYYDRYTVRTNVQGRPKDWLKTGGNISLSYTKTQGTDAWGGAGSVSNYSGGGLSFLLNPLYSAIDPETGKQYTPYFPFGMESEYYYVEKYPSISTGYSLLGSFFVELEPIKNLKINSRAGIDGGFGLGFTTRYPSYLGAEGNGGRARSTSLSYTATVTNTAEYSFRIANDHHFILLAGHEGVVSTADSYSASTTGITDDRLTNLQNGDQKTYSVSESFSQSKFLSFFGRIDYSLKDKYYFDASIRNDASSRFGKKNRNATFWAVGGMWKMKQEGFLRDASWLNDLNFKVSYGTQGNASIGDYEHLAIIGTTTDYHESSATVIGKPSNPGLTWEQQALLTVGFNGRIAHFLDFNIEFYNRTTSAMLMDVPYNYTTGFDTLYANVGSMENTGIDLTLGFDILRGKDYYFRTQATFNYNDERVTELFNGAERWEMASTGLAYVLDKPVSFYAPIYAGVDPADGLPMWYLPGENIDEPQMDPEKVTKEFDSATLTQNTGKRLYAPINGGFSFMGGWKGWSLQADFSYVLGKTLINNDMLFYANPNQFTTQNQHKTVSDYWTPENTDAKWPAWDKGVTLLNLDTHMFEDASFLRLKNLQVAYSLPKRFLGNQSVLSGVKVSFTGRNLFTVTNYSGIDPEVNGNLTYGRLGASKQYLFGLELTF